MTSSSTKYRVTKIQGPAGGLKEAEDALVFPPKVGENLLIGVENELWRTTPVERIEVAGQSLFVYTKNSVYQLEKKDADDETES